MPSISKQPRPPIPAAGFVDLRFQSSIIRVCSAPALGEALPGAELDGRASLKVLAMAGTSRDVRRTQLRIYVPECRNVDVGR